MDFFKKKLLPVLAAVTMLFAFAACEGQGNTAPGTDCDSDDIYENTITVLNVGQAQCSLVQSAGEYMLLDAGFADGETNIVEYLQQRGVTELKLFVLTHFHFDHTSEVLEILRNFKVDTMIIPDLSEENTPTNSFYRTLLEKAGKGQYDLYLAQKDRQYPLGAGMVTILADTYNQPKSKDEGKNTSQRINNTSISLIFAQQTPYGIFTMLDTGDAEEDVEESLIDLVPKNIDFFNAGHHGSKDANTYNFLKKINPNFTVVSCGENNDYGHPHKQTVKRFNDLKLTYVITYEEGNVVYSINENRWLEGVH